MHTYEWILVHWPTSWRQRVAVVVVVVVFVLAALPLVFRVAGYAVDLGIVPYVALWILCWVGEGGLVVPIPGVRLLSWLTIVQLGANLEPAFVAVLAAVAMACGQSSYFLVVRSGSRLVEDHLAVGPLRGRLPIPVPAPAADVRAADDSPTDLLDATSGGATSDDAMGPGDAGTPGDPGTTGDTGKARHDRLAHAASAVSRRLQAHPRRAIFLVSIVPSPLTTVTTVGAATVGIPFRTFFLAAVSGFLILTSVLAFAGQAIVAFIKL